MVGFGPKFRAGSEESFQPTIRLKAGPAIFLRKSSCHAPFLCHSNGDVHEAMRYVTSVTVPFQYKLRQISGIVVE